MKFTFPDISTVFDTSEGKINTIVIESPGLMVRLVQDITNQLSGSDGLAVLSEGERPIPINKYLEFVDQFFPFDVNKKTLINKITSIMCQRAVEGENYLKTAEYTSRLEAFMYELSMELPCKLDFSGIGIESIIKASTLIIEDDYTSLSEKVIGYMQLVNELERHKLFITLNFRSFVDEEENLLFMKTVLDHGIDLIMIENHDYPVTEMENRVIIDKNLCEIKL